MLRKIVISSLVLTLAGGLSACSTVTDNIPTVKIERKAKRVKTVETRHQVQAASYTAPKVQKAEAAMVCENDNMRGRAADRDMKNDMARVLILERAVISNCPDNTSLYNHPISTNTCIFSANTAPYHRGPCTVSETQDAAADCQSEYTG